MRDDRETQLQILRAAGRIKPRPELEENWVPYGVTYNYQVSDREWFEENRGAVIEIMEAATRE